MRCSLILLLFSTLALSRPASAQEPALDPSFASMALDFLERGDTALLTRIAASPAGHHLGAHARQVSITPDGPTDRQLVERILDSTQAAGLSVPAVRAFLHTILGDWPSLARCWSEAAEYLPPAAVQRAVLYLQIGYDIGVAVSGEASLNIAHPHFAADPPEIWFYCVHEVHHAGLESYHDLLYLSRIKTTRDLAALVRYLTFLEGMAVRAARGWRAELHALGGDPDYVALGDSTRMARYESGKEANKRAATATRRPTRTRQRRRNCNRPRNPLGDSGDGEGVQISAPFGRIEQALMVVGKP